MKRLHRNVEPMMIIPALLVLLMLVGGYAWLSSQPVGLEGDTMRVGRPEPRTDVQVSDLNISAVNAAALASLPDRFPTTISVDDATVTESYVAVYPQNGATQYSLSFFSQSAKSELWDKYVAFTEENGFLINEDKTDRETVLVAEKGEDTLTVVLTTIKAQTLVQVGLLDRV